MKKYKLSHIISFLMAIVIALSLPMLSPQTVNAIKSKDNSDGQNISLDEYKYRDYYRNNSAATSPMTSLKVNPSEGYNASDAVVSVGEFAGKNNVLIWNNGIGELSWNVNIPETGNYFLRLTYYSINKNVKDVQIGIKLDNTTPFFEAQQITLPKCFKAEGEIKRDMKGNDRRPKQVPYEEWITSPINDTTGVSDEPYRFYLSQGVHSITICGVSANIAIESIEFYNEKPLPSYKEYSANAVNSKTDYKKTYEAEKPLYQSSSMLYPTYDRTSVDTSPSDPSKIRYNTIGQNNYNTQGQYIVWNVEAPEDGYYYLGARIRKNISSGTVSYRRLYINDTVPFKEAATVKFEFNNRWQQYVFGGDQPWLIKLNKGDNQIKLEVVIGDMATIISDLQKLVSDINALYREIIMITGTSPDNFRDYHIDKEIAGFNQRVKEMLEESGSIYDTAIKLGNDGSGDFSAITKLRVLLEKFIKSPDVITSNISSLNSYSSGISSLVLNLKSQPLELDSITISNTTDKLTTKNTGIFGNIFFQLKAFVASFTQDYNDSSTSKSNIESNINVWISAGREQATILTDLTDSLFTPKYKIAAKVSLVQQSLIQASLSGMSPDVVLYVGDDAPVELAIRDGLVPMSQFDTFEKVTSRFHPASMTGYYFLGDYYGIPLVENFSVMFYRTDILKSLNLTPPDTWDDMYKIIRVLQQNNLSVGIPNTGSGSVMAVDTSIYFTFMYQRGEKLYADDLKSTNLQSNIGIESFSKWTEFYKDYGIPTQYNFFNRFRSGDMPIGISVYSLYGQLKQTAPEIDGLWEMIPIPGTKDENGKIRRDVALNGSCAVIMKGSKNREAAWRYIDWFSDTEAQSQYGQQLESILGISSRYSPANVAVLEKLSWSHKDMAIINEQWDQGFMVPKTPGDYILSRNIINAFRKVVFSSANPREAIVSYNKTIEKEMSRKRAEYSLD